MAHQQEHLFSPVVPGLEGRALSSGAAIWDAIACAPSLLAAAERAARANASASRGNRGAGEDFERELNKALTPAVQAAVAREVLAALDPAATPAFGRIVDLSWHYLAGEGRSPADFEVVVTTDSGGLLEMPVNVKWSSGGRAAGVADACALRTAIRVARGESVTSNSAVNVPRTALEWYAGRERIQASDYWLLIVEGDRAAGTVAGIHAQGLLSAVADDGTLAMSRHPSREVALFRHAYAVLPDGFDVNQAFARALSPQANADDTRLALLSFLAASARLSVDRTAALAAQLLDTPDAELAALLAGALLDRAA